jgi:hypothetical protein
MSKKDKLTKLLHLIRDYQLAFDGYLSEADRDEVGTADSWSAKDDLAHSMFWANFALARMEAHERSEPEPPREYKDYEDQNKVTFEEYKDASWEEVKEMIRDSYAAVDAYIDRVGEAGLLETPDGRPYPNWQDIASSYIVHPGIHLWTYLEKRGYGELREQIMGTPFFEEMLALDDGDEWRGANYYNMACNLALTGQSGEAIELLEEALRLRPDLVEWSKEDADLDSLRELPHYQALYEG